LAWAGVGLTGALAMLQGRRLRTGSSSETENPDPTGLVPVAMTSIPSGYRRLKQTEVTPELTQKAKDILREHGRDPYGTKVPFETGGTNYMAVIEQHYHEPGGPLKPWGYHHGVSLFVEAQA
jgi:hypothetical protein